LSRIAPSLIARGADLPQYGASAANAQTAAHFALLFFAGRTNHRDGPAAASRGYSNPSREIRPHGPAPDRLASFETQIPEERGITMDTRQAKDFLVQQTAEQAMLDSVPFSDLEKRMMYFTESDPTSCPDPLELNDKFEKQYETEEYEAKVSQLLQHAYKRLKHEDPEALRNWNEAVRTLRKGDHYILVLL